MERKTKIFTGAVSVVLFLIFIGYFISLFNGNENNLSTYSNLILVCTCLTGILWSKQKIEKKFFDVLVKVNGVLFVIWVGIAVVQLFI